MWLAGEQRAEMTDPSPFAPVTRAPTCNAKQSVGVEFVGVPRSNSDVSKNVPSSLSSYTESISLVAKGPMPYTCMVISTSDQPKWGMFLGPIVKAPRSIFFRAEWSKRLPMPNHQAP